MLNNKAHLLKKLEEEGCLLLPEMERALIGISEGIYPKAVYDRDICLNILEDVMMIDPETAITYFYSTLVGTLGADNSPLIVETI